MRPHVMINMAMSVDGKVSSIAREPTAFTSREDRQLLLEIRSRCDALVVGARTAALDYETMGIPDARLCQARLRRGQREHPLRVIISGRLGLTSQLPLLRAPVSPLLIVCCESAPCFRRKLFARFGHLIVCGRREVDVRRLVKRLAVEYQARVILCEGGPTLNDAFFRAGVVDELHLTLCPRIVGGKTAPTLSEGVGVNRLADATPARLVGLRRGETEWFLRYRLKRG